ncbi:hypothetical protein fh0823_23610 [Francisella halioticida]|uniref:EBNA-1 nuclear protein n=1 Tax=Francisella halioticida TaxID=549298 RepID=A0ABN5B2R9_9GAMM|nr:DUF1611 domain-containing protein [Francisella halioticida]ASG68937.1 EBNA-1 nuclear protein [Francisella halioticida]BCD92222.1 hypothetical protein fh0823_23610 [Francisella halioticida]
MKKQKTAIIYCEANFGKLDGKTANGLIRYSDEYKILAVIDSTKANLDSGVVLDNIPNGIPIYDSYISALKELPNKANYFILGMAPATGILSNKERKIIMEIIKLGINIINGLHVFLNDDPELSFTAAKHNVKILDIRKPPEKKNLRIYNGDISKVTCPIIAILGTDCAIGKRTTTNILTKIFNEAGYKAVMVGTGQTSLIQGAKYGVAIDAIPSQFCIGELEATVVSAFNEEQPDIIFVEGQSSLSHPAFSSSSFILRACCPDAVILQHAPKREYRCDFENIKMPKLSNEINLIETFSQTKVIGISINHENIDAAEIKQIINNYSKKYKIPTADALRSSPDYFIDMIVSEFPQLSGKFNT